MKTKAQIVQDLLEKKQITAEEAVTLLMSSGEKEYVYVPVYPASPYIPAVPTSPWQSPFIVTCDQNNNYAAVAHNVVPLKVSNFIN